MPVLLPHTQVQRRTETQTAATDLDANLDVRERVALLSMLLPCAEVGRAVLALRDARVPHCRQLGAKRGAAFCMRLAPRK